MSPATTVTVTVAGVEIANTRPLVLISGPCQIESRTHALEVATALAEICRAANIGLIFKSSYDKANRTSATAQRGIGMAQGLEILAEIRHTIGWPVLTAVPPAARTVTFFSGRPSACARTAAGQASSQPPLAGRSGLTATPSFSSAETQPPSDPVVGQDPPPSARITASASKLRTASST